MLNKYRLKHLAILTAILAGSPVLANEAGTLKLGLAAEISSIDPQYLNSAPNISFAHHIFETMVDVDAEGQLYPRLATS